MVKFELVLLDPSPGEIAEALADATAATNKRCRTRLLADDPAKWRKFARQTQAAPEGYDLFRGGRGGAPGTQLVGAWWTDHIGRKHVVVRGRRIEHDISKVLFFKDELDRRPPLWHCYPQYLYQRWRPVENDLPAVDWIAVCGCGASGTPAALGWMGETCGPCHDRREEGESLAGNRPGWLHGARNPFGSLAYSRDGVKLAAVETDGTVSIWDLENPGEPVRFKDAGSRPVQESQVQFAGSDDEFLILNILNGANGTVTVREWRLPDKPPVTVNHEEIGEFHIWPSRSPNYAVVASSGLALFTMDGRYTTVQHAPRQYFRLPPATEPKPKFVPVVGTEGLRLLDSMTLELRHEIPYRITRIPEGHVYHNIRVAFRESSGTVFISRSDKLDVYDLAARSYRTQIALHRVPVAAFHNAPAWVRAMALTAGEGYLVLAVDERLVVLDAESLTPLAAFAWHLGPIGSLAASPDGRALATASVEGSVKLWPIHQLLEAIGERGASAP